MYYRADETQEASERKQKFSFLRAYHELRRAFDKLSKGYINGMSREKRNAIAYALTAYKTEKSIRTGLENAGLTEDDLNIALSIGSFSKFGHISVKACDNYNTADKVKKVNLDLPYQELLGNYNIAG